MSFKLFSAHLYKMSIILAIFGNIIDFLSIYANIISMNIISVILPYIQVVLSVLVVIGVLLQYSAAGIGGAFGGGDSFDSGLHTRRGFEKFLFFGTILAGVLFAVSCLVAFLIK